MDVALDIDRMAKVMTLYAGRDKALRSLAFWLQFESTKVSPELAKNILGLAKQMSTTRLVLRQFNHFGMLKACRSVLEAVKTKHFGDPIEFVTGANVTLIYTFYGFIELTAWLSDAKILNFDAAKLFRYCHYMWIVALINGIIRQVRTLFLNNRLLHKPDAQKKNKEDIITLVGLTSDFISGVNGLPHPGLLWAGKLSLKNSALFSLLASVIGFYKLL